MRYRSSIVGAVRAAIVAVGIFAVAGAGGRAAGQQVRGDATGDQFGRMFDLPAFAAPTPEVKAALAELGKRGGLMDARDNLSAGPVALIVDPPSTSTIRTTTTIPRASRSWVSSSITT